MRFSAFKKLLSNNGRFKPDDPDFRRAYLLNVVLVFLIFYCTFYAFFNISNKVYLGTMIDAITAALDIAVFIYFHKTDNLKACSYAIVAVVFFAIATTIAIVGQQYYILVWVCIFPPMTFFLLGRKPGLIIMGLMLLILIGFIAINYPQWSVSGFSAKSIVNILGPFAAVSALVWFFELSRNDAVSYAKQKNTELDTANKALAESREYLRLILDSTAEAIFGTDMNCKFTFCNKRFLEMLGYTDQKDILGKDIYNQLHGQQEADTIHLRSNCNILKTCTQGVVTHSDSELFLRSDGVELGVEYYSYPQYRDGVLVGAVVTFTDNTQKKLNAQQAEYFGLHDALTGLKNRRYFETELRRLDTEDNLPISIIMADLNGLKLSNDVFGHDVGDVLLMKAADALKKSCRGEEIIARVGGDEFAVLLTKTHTNDALAIISRIKKALAREKADIIQCSMSLGCDTKTLVSEDIDATLKNAEHGMYKDKVLNRNKVSADMLSMIIMSLYEKCPFEEQHSINVGILCRSFGEALCLPEPEIAQLVRAGLFHDVGKISLGEELLNKIGAVTEDEKIVYKQHPVIGYRILNLYDNTLNLAEAIYSHHERWNGTGYPRALKGSQIPVFARIISIVGYYDRYINGYHQKSLGHEQVLQQLREKAGTLFDPNLVSAFVEMMQDNPP